MCLPNDQQVPVQTRHQLLSAGVNTSMHLALLTLTHKVQTYYKYYSHFMAVTHGNWQSVIVGTIS